MWHVHPFLLRRLEAFRNETRKNVWFNFLRFKLVAVDTLLSIARSWCRHICLAGCCGHPHVDDYLRCCYYFAGRGWDTIMDDMGPGGDRYTDLYADRCTALFGGYRVHDDAVLSVMAPCVAWCGGYTATVDVQIDSYH